MAEPGDNSRIPLHEAVVVLGNDQGAPLGAHGYVLEDYGDAYEIEVSNPDGSTAWIGALSDDAVRRA